MSNGTIATHAMVHFAVDRSKGPVSTAIGLVPLDLPGVSKGKPLNKIGQRALNQGEIFFDNVRIPDYYVFVPPELYPLAGDMILATANGGMGVDVHRPGARRLRGGDDLLQAARAGRQAALRAPARAAQAVRHVHQGGVGEAVVAGGADVQRGRHAAGVALRRRFEGVLHAGRLRGRQRRRAALRRDGSLQGVPRREAVPRCPRRADRGRRQRHAGAGGARARSSTTSCSSYAIRGATRRA